MIQVSGRVLGTRRVYATIGKLADMLGPKDSRKVLSDSLRRTVRPYVDRLRELTPVDTGELRQSSTIRTRNKRGTNVPVVFVGWFQRNTGLNPQQARAQAIKQLVVEFGTRDGGRTGVYALRRIADEISSNGRAEFRQNFVKSLDKVTGQLAKRNAQQAKADRSKARR